MEMQRLYLIFSSSYMQSLSASCQARRLVKIYFYRKTAACRSEGLLGQPAAYAASSILISRPTVARARCSILILCLSSTRGRWIRRPTHCSCEPSFFSMFILRVSLRI